MSDLVERVARGEWEGNRAAWAEVAKAKEIAAARAERLREALEEIKRLSRHQITQSEHLVNQRACEALEEEDKE